MAFCVKCGEGLEDQAAFCSGCGTRVGAAASDVSAAATPPQAERQAAGAPSQPAPAARRFAASRRFTIIAVTSVVCLAAVVVAGFLILGSGTVRAQAMLALARHYQGTWVDQDTGDGVTIDTSGGIIKVRIFRSDGSSAGAITATGSSLSFGDGSDSQTHLSIGSDKVTVTEYDGTTMTFIRQPLGGGE